ncbi:hypothetical protein FDK13_15330 [Dyadobacter frigoris]|uniref:Uncharacterized protein n=2 Tax=Dyadobacter frigoris TaxID=2576211 RepID=A0A4U6D6A7_9BACT|nr:hypothetical protein FDK13_15330 [Dyadobacter frigoris]
MLRKSSSTLLILVLFSFIFILKNHLKGDLYQDENHYLPTAVQFSSQPIPSLHLLETYEQLNTPIPFILGGWTIKVFGENIQNLRLLTFCLSFILILIFIWTSPDTTPVRFWLSLCGLLIFPNYYLISVFYYTDIFAMLFVLLGLVYYLRGSHLFGAIFFIAAICSRQYMLAFPAAIVADGLTNSLRKSASISGFIKNISSNKTWVYYTIAVLSIVPWIILWKGFAPKALMIAQHYAQNQLTDYNPGYVLYAAAIIACYYVIPEAIATRKIHYYIAYPKLHPNYFFTMVFGISLLVYLCPAQQAYNEYFTWPYLGYVDQLMINIGLDGAPKQIIFGLLMLITCMRFISPHINLVSWLFIINTLLLGKAQLSWDKYSLPLIMTLWFLLMFDKYWFFYVQKPVEGKHIDKGTLHYS